MRPSVPIKVRIALLALEKDFPYYSDEDLAFNISAFLLSCKLSTYESRLIYTFVLESPSISDNPTFTDLAEVADPFCHLLPNSVVYLTPQRVASIQEFQLRRHVSFSNVVKVELVDKYIRKMDEEMSSDHSSSLVLNEVIEETKDGQPETAFIDVDNYVEFF